MSSITTYTLILICIILLVLFYYFMLLPKAVYKEIFKNEKYYYADLKNLSECIERANNKSQLKLCSEAVYRFEKRNKKHKQYNVRRDVSDLISKIERKALSF